MCKPLCSTLVVLAMLTGCATTQPRIAPAAPDASAIEPRVAAPAQDAPVEPEAIAPAARSARISPEQAVLAAAHAAPAGVPGTFALRVQATGSQHGRFFLNSELDYRDQRNLTIAMSRRVLEQLAARMGGDPLTLLKGRDILVDGIARRTKIYFLVDDRLTDKYYYQTHVNVDDAAQVSVVEN